MQERTILLLLIPALWLAPGPLPAGETSGSFGLAGPDDEGFRGTSLRYRVSASNPRVNRRVTSPPTRLVQGVPAQPVDSMVWNGVGSRWIDGSLVMEIDPIRSSGHIRARWTDEYGNWGFEQTRFLHPDSHASGVRIGSSVTSVVEAFKEAISHNVYLHGDTMSGQPVLPTVFNHLATWGRAEVTLNDEVFENPFDFPGPEQWVAHSMVSEGVRWPDGTVRTNTWGIYDPSHQSEGMVEEGDLEVHLVFHDERNVQLNPDNVPPLFDFFYHLVYEDVTIEIAERDKPASSDRPGGSFSRGVRSRSR